MKRLLAAVGLAAVVCLALVLSACTDSTSLDDPLLESQTVSGTVWWGNTGNTVPGAKVIIWYTEDGTIWHHAKKWTGGPWFEWVIADASGNYGVYYCDAAKNEDGKVTAEKTVGLDTYFGVTEFTYPNGTHTCQDVRVFIE